MGISPNTTVNGIFWVIFNSVCQQINACTSVNLRKMATYKKMFGSVW